MAHHPTSSFHQWLDAQVPNSFQNNRSIFIDVAFNIIDTLIIVNHLYSTNVVENENILLKRFMKINELPGTDSPGEFFKIGIDNDTYIQTFIMKNKNSPSARNDLIKKTNHHIIDMKRIK